MLFATPKLELIPNKTFVSREAPRLAEFDSIEALYIRMRMQSAVDCQSPAQSEEHFNRLRYVY